MTAVLLDGRSLATYIKSDLQKRIASLRLQRNIVPALAVIRVGDNPASELYVALKCRQSQEIGINSIEHYFPEQTAETTLLKTIHELNVNKDIHGILLQLPLPSHLNPFKLIQAIDPLKDVDGLHPYNQGALALGKPHVIPCTPKGCLTLLKSYQETIKGLHAVILGRSILVGRPLAMLLLSSDCSVTVLHSQSHNIPALARSADILIAAVGKPKLVQKEWVKPGAIVLDVGINPLKDHNGGTTLVGDVDFEAVSQIAKAISPVPGGIGPMTVASLLENTFEAALKQTSP